MSNSSDKKLQLFLGPCLFALLGFAGGCSSVGEARFQSPDIRERLLANARRSDQWFPDGKDVKLTVFAYVGRAQTKEGCAYVVELRQVLTGMLSPRGAAYILFFNSKEELVAKESIHDYRAGPLWCDGGLLFLYGADNNGDRIWNAWDLSEGISKRKRILKPEYGSWRPEE
ncbi:hypothetical protein LCGC14_2419080 [marine sediment metagenome]|uniref:Lipoprotein n=1 Tax=marine sediment metagenome TaxID=412755 RepID=A0A0F9BQB6_9ZZZZ